VQQANQCLSVSLHAPGRLTGLLYGSRLRSSACSHTGSPCARMQDLRSSRCMQTINEADWRSPEDAHPTALTYDASCHRLITAGRRPLAWTISSGSTELATHAEPWWPPCLTRCLTWYAPKHDVSFLSAKW
jgi:hypothetical protein